MFFSLFVKPWRWKVFWMSRLIGITWSSPQTSSIVTMFLLCNTFYVIWWRYANIINCSLSCRQIWNERIPMWTPNLWAQWCFLVFERSDRYNLQISTEHIHLPSNYSKINFDQTSEFYSQMCASKLFTFYVSVYVLAMISNFTQQMNGMNVHQMESWPIDLL